MYEKVKAEEGVQLVKKEDLSLAENSFLNDNQLSRILKRTPAKYVRERPAKGGGKWKYVSGGYVKKTLNLMFGFDWDFDILHQEVMFGEVIVKGRLTCRTNGRTIVKTQFGNKEIVYKKAVGPNGEQVPLSIGNDLKSAATDALKKCAAEFGIAADIYNPEEFREVFLTVDASDGPPAEDVSAQNMQKIRTLLTNPKVDQILAASVSKSLDTVASQEPKDQQRIINELEKSITK